jgi:type I restriction enzyme S subunit
MTAAFKPYPKYKPSGVEWLGDVPEHWEVTKLKRMFSERDERSATGAETLLSVSSYTGVTPKADKLAEGDLLSRAESLEGYKVCHTNDLVINIMLAWNRGLGVTSHHGIVSPAYAVFKLLDESDPKFLHYLFRSKRYLLYFKSFSSGVIDSRLRLYPEVFLSLFCSLPSVLEQNAIANFLDSETAKIDEIVKELDDLIALANEEVSSMVFSSTKSRQMRLAWATNEVSRPLAVGAEGTFTKIGLLNRGRGLFHKDPSESNEMGDSDFFFVEEGDCIISGQFAWEGAVALADKEDTGCVVSHRYPVIRGKEGVALTEYIYALLCTTHGNFLLNDNSRGAAGRNRPLNIRTLLREKVPIPDIATQERVARAVHKKKEVLKEVKVMKVLLDEYRTSLIHEAVTGKIDLRNA